LGYNPAHGPIHFLKPASAQKVVFSALLTGHGWGVDEANCAEFCNHVHHFSVNGRESPLLVKDHAVASSAQGCQELVRDGVVPNQFGTWPLGRAGWCPGKDVDWWEVDITPFLVEGENVIAYHALFNDTDYEPAPAADAHDLGFSAEIHLVSALVFYGDREALQPPQTILP